MPMMPWRFSTTGKGCSSTPADAARALERAPLNMSVASRAEEKEHLKAEALIYTCQGSDPLVVRWMNEDPHLYALNESLLNAAAKKDEEESDGHDDFGDEVFGPSSDADEAGPSRRG